MRRFNQTSLLYIPLFFEDISMVFAYRVGLQYIIIAVVVPILYWLIDFKRLRLLMADISYVPGEVPTPIYFIQLVNSILLIIGEEIFFRYTIYHIFLNRGIWTVAIISVVLFVLSHLIINPSFYNTSEKFKQILFSVLCCYLVFKTNSVICAVLAHFTYNLPYILILTRRIFLNKLEN